MNRVGNFRFPYLGKFGFLLTVRRLLNRTSCYRCAVACVGRQIRDNQPEQHSPEILAEAFVVGDLCCRRATAVDNIVSGEIDNRLGAKGGQRHLVSAIGDPEPLAACDHCTALGKVGKRPHDLLPAHDRQHLARGRGTFNIQEQRAIQD